MGVKSLKSGEKQEEEWMPDFVPLLVPAFLVFATSFCSLHPVKNDSCSSIMIEREREGRGGGERKLAPCRDVFF